ncbi:hypothetical protein NLI96_g10720 [Meripilus lineatus]|uniref:ribonuclease T2 n=1 Tax=Meripilus lineatus TaxID=2056292 RepID=A0AAD5UTF1_9APHY|nr:hypothetical protein NLI96_g10720 [Physisporinus lineatus]
MLSAALLLAALGGLSWAYPSGTTPFDDMHVFKRISSGCGTSGQTSCHNTTRQTDLCCFESPGVRENPRSFRLTRRSFIILSRVYCFRLRFASHLQGSEGCIEPLLKTVLGHQPLYRAVKQLDNTRSLAGQLLTAQGASDTLAFMQNFWVDINGQNEQFWEHEWSTHGTCYSTLETSCLPSGSARGAEAVAFFNTVVKLFKSLPTYDWLAAAGITPSTTATYTLSTLTSALKSASGFTPALDCSGTSINQISWYFNLKGSAIDGQFVPIDAPKKGSCASSGLKYPPKSGSPTTSSGGSTPTGASTAENSVKKMITHLQIQGALPAKAQLVASSTGGLLTAGTWSVQTLATYTLTGSTSSFTMSTSKGKCAVQSGQLTCGSGVSTASSFSAVTSGSKLLLAFSGSTAFTSDSTPSGTVQQTVFTGSSHSVDYTISIVST